MWGDKFLPQTKVSKLKLNILLTYKLLKVIPLVDLVITHGGNNTLTESFYYGKPMIVLPLFGDQHDNAQRIHEKGFGIRLKPFRATPKEFNDAIEKLLNDNELKVKMEKIAMRIQNSKSNEKAAHLIEGVLNK